jgi:hypothetical protein
MTDYFSAAIGVIISMTLLVAWMNLTWITEKIKDIGVWWQK